MECLEHLRDMKVLRVGFVVGIIAYSHISDHIDEPDCVFRLLRILKSRGKVYMST